MNRLKKIFTTATVGLLVVTSLISCHKYPEDPFISLRQPSKRLQIGSWQITSFQINGTEHYHDLDSLLAPATLIDCKIGFSELDYHIEDNTGRWIYHNSDDRYEFPHINTIRIRATNILFNEMFWQVPNGTSGVPSSEWTIREMYGQHMHWRLNNIDIYFKHIK